MSAAPFVVATAIGAGVGLPPVLARVRWLRRVPAAAVGLWISLAATFVTALVLVAYQLLAADRHGAARGMLSTLDVCAVDLIRGQGTAGVGGLLLVAIVVGAWPLGWITAAHARSRAARRRHADLLVVAARPISGLPGTAVLEHDVAAAYCLPGRHPRIVVTSAAMAQLSRAQLRAVLAHEQAHIRGRHHVVTAFVDGFARAFPALPLARHAREQVKLLLEMAADDQVLREHRSLDLAAAMYTMAAAQTPPSAFGAGGECLERMERLSTAAPRPRRALTLGLGALAMLAPLLPLLLSCTAHHG